MYQNMNNTEKIVFGALLLLFIFLFGAAGYSIKNIRSQTKDLELENSELRMRVDSLLVECELKDSTVSNAVGIALDLSERINLLYYKDKEAHAKLFE